MFTIFLKCSQWYKILWSVINLVQVPWWGGRLRRRVKGSQTPASTDFTDVVGIFITTQILLPTLSQISTSNFSTSSKMKKMCDRILHNEVDFQTGKEGLRQIAEIMSFRWKATERFNWQLEKKDGAAAAGDGQDDWDVFSALESIYRNCIFLVSVRRMPSWAERGRATCVNAGIIDFITHFWVELSSTSHQVQVFLAAFPSVK